VISTAECCAGAKFIENEYYNIWFDYCCWCILFENWFLPEGLAEELPKVLKIRKWLVYKFSHWNLDEKHSRCISTRPRPVLRGPGTGKYGLGNRVRKIGFRGVGARGRHARYGRETLGNHNMFPADSWKPSHSDQHLTKPCNRKWNPTV